VDVDAERVLELRAVCVDVTELLLEMREVVEGLVVTEEERVVDTLPVELLMPLIVRDDDTLVLGLRL
jgi:hypothetical protein